MKNFSLLRLVAGIILSSSLLWSTTLPSQEQSYKVGGYRQEGTPSVITLEPSRLILSQKIEEIRNLREALHKGAYDLLTSPDFQRLLGTRSGVDEIEFDSVTTTMLGYHVIFKQYYRSGNLKIPVLGQITVNVDTQGRAMWVSNNMEGGVNIEGVERAIDSRRAIETAVNEYRNRGEALPSSLPSEELVKLMIRRISQHTEGDQRETGRQKEYQDELVYNILFSRAGAPNLAGNIVVVDAVSGEVLHFENTASKFLNESGSADNALVGDPTSGSVAPPPPVSTNPVPSGPVSDNDLEASNCYNGTGFDRFGIARKFPTTYNGEKNDKANYFTVSCDNRIWIYKLDLIFPQDPDIKDSGGTARSYSSLYSDKNNLFLNASVVDLGYWCEQLLDYLADRGYTHRKAIDENGPIPYEIHAKPDAVDPGLVNAGNLGPAIYNWTNSWYYSTDDIIDINLKSKVKGNGIIRFGSGDLSKGYRSITDPQMIAHEFFHSIINDQITPGLIKDPPEFSPMHEGFCDVFAMLFSHFVINYNGYFLGLGEWTVYPFHIGSRLFVDPNNQQRGIRNLEYPRDPVTINNNQNPRWAVWHGARILYNQKHFINPISYELFTDPKSFWDTHWASTLISEWAYLMIAGSGSEKDCPVKTKATPDKYTTTPVEPWVNVPVGGKYSFSHDDDDYQLKWEHLEEFFLTLVHNGNISPNMSLYNLRDVMVAWADSFVKSGIWPSFNGLNAGERVQQAFALLGFGNGVEGDEPHTFETIMTNPIASQNLISVGYSEERHLPINFSLKPNQKSYFVLNEKLFKGDTIEFVVENMSGNSNSADVRFYADKAVDIDEKAILGMDGTGCDAKYQQGMKYQMYPAVDFCGIPLNVIDPGVPPPQSGSFILTTFDRCEFPKKPASVLCQGGLNPDSIYHPIYVGVKIIKGNCNCDTDFKLTVKVKRTGLKGKVYWDESP